MQFSCACIYLQQKLLCVTAHSYNSMGTSYIQTSIELHFHADYTLIQDLCHTHTVVHVTFVKYYRTHEEVEAAFRDICHLLPMPNFMKWLFVLPVYVRHCY